MMFATGRKKAISAAMSVVLALGMMPAPAFAADPARDTGAPAAEAAGVPVALRVALAVDATGIASPDAGGAPVDAQSASYKARLAEIEQDTGEYKPGEMIVVYEEGATPREKVASVRAIEESPSVELVVADLIGEGGTEVKVSLPDDMSVAEAVAQTGEMPGVAIAQPNYVYRLADKDVTEIGAAQAEALGATTDGAPTFTSVNPLASDVTVNDPYAAVSTDSKSTENQWWLHSVDAFKAWDTSKVEGKVSVAVIDTGINFDHPDLTNVIDREHAYDAYAQRKLTTNPSSESYAHGSHVAGIVAGETNNGVGIAGVSYNATIIPIAVFYYSAYYGDTVTDDEYLVRAYQYLLAQDIDDLRVINMSLGGYGASDTALETQIKAATSRGIMTVAAGGNGDSYGNPRTDHSWPSDYEDVVAVTCLQSNDTRTTWSDYNDSKDIAAPGAQIWSTWWTGSRYYCASGTSMASPLVAGVVALLFAYDPDLTVEECKEALYSSAIDLGTPGKDPYYGWGKVNPVGALAALSPARINAERDSMVRTTSQKLSAELLNEDFKLTGSWQWSVDDPSIASVSSDGVLTALAPGKVKVRVEGSGDETLCGEKVVTVTDIQLPNALLVNPFAAVADGIRLTWPAAEAATSYDVFRATGEGGEPSLPASVEDDGSLSYVYDDETAESGVEYWYSVRPNGRLGDAPVEGARSDEVRGYFIDLRALRSTIDQVKANRAATAVSKDGSDVSGSAQWVTQRYDDLLVYALSKAQLVANNSQATLADLTTVEGNLRQVWESYDASKRYGTMVTTYAVRDLAAAQSAFDAAKAYGRKALDISALVAAVALAKSLRSSVVLSADGSDVESTGYWITRAAYETFVLAISKANRAIGATGNTQAAIDKAVEDLKAA